MNKTEEMQLMDKVHKLKQDGYQFRATGNKSGWKVEIYGPDAMCVGKGKSDNLILALGHAVDDAGDHLPTSATYRIETRAQGCRDARGWTTEGVAPDMRDNRFGTRAEAETAIAELRALGDEWAAADYRVVEVTS